MGYISGLIEVLDFDQPEAAALYSFHVPNDDADPEDPNTKYVPYFDDPEKNGDGYLGQCMGFVDVDSWNNSEDNLVLTFLEHVLGFLNMHTRQFCLTSFN